MNLKERGITVGDLLIIVIIIIITTFAIKKINSDNKSSYLSSIEETTYFKIKELI